MDLKRLGQILRTRLGSAAVPAFVTALASVAVAPPAAHAQEPVVAEPAPLPPGHVPVIVDPPGEPPSAGAQSGFPPLPPMTERAAYRRAVLSWRSLRARNILIGTSVATAVGAALVFPAEFTQCGDTDPEGEMTLDRCSPGGKAMVLIGYPLLLFGGVAMIASGIVLGVTNGQLRRSEPRGSRRRTQALRWDPATSGFVF
jgi:hypothetical protein